MSSWRKFAGRTGPVYVVTADNDLGREVRDKWELNILSPKSAYSGGGKNEKHRAGKRIEEMLNWREYAGSSGLLYVVTADNDLGREARMSGS